MLFWMTGEFLGSSWLKKDCCALQVFNADILLWHFWLWIVRLIYNFWNYDILDFFYFWIRNSHVSVLYLVSTQFSETTDRSDFFYQNQSLMLTMGIGHIKVFFSHLVFKLFKLLSFAFCLMILASIGILPFYSSFSSSSSIILNMHDACIILTLIIHSWAE